MKLLNKIDCLETKLGSFNGVAFAFGYGLEGNLDVLIIENGVIDMESCLKKAIILACLPLVAGVFSSNHAEARDRQEYFNYDDAGKANLITGSAGLGGSITTGILLNKVYDPLAWKPIIPVENGLGHVLENSEIEKVISTIRKSPLSSFGKNFLGGATVEITMDQAQWNRMLGTQNRGTVLEGVLQDGKVKLVDATSGRPVDPAHLNLNVAPAGAEAESELIESAEKSASSFETRKLNVLTHGGTEGIETYLKRAQKAGVSFRQVNFRGFLVAGGRRVAGNLNVIVGIASVAHLATSLGQYKEWRSDSWFAKNCDEDNDYCQDPSWIEAMSFNAAPLFYYFQADKYQKQTEGRNGVNRGN